MRKREDDPNHFYWQAPHIYQRFGITAMTLHRWLARFGFPKPTVIAGRRYWRQSDVLAWEQQCAEGKTKRPALG